MTLRIDHSQKSKASRLIYCRYYTFLSIAWDHLPLQVHSLLLISHLFMSFTFTFIPNHHLSFRLRKSKIYVMKNDKNNMAKVVASLTMHVKYLDELQHLRQVLMKSKAKEVKSYTL